MYNGDIYNLSNNIIKLKTHTSQKCIVCAVYNIAAIKL